MAWLVLLLGCLVGAGMLGGPPTAQLPHLVWIWLLGASTLEFLAIRLPVLGFASLAPVLWLGLAGQYPKLGWLSLLGVSVGAGLRSLSRARSGALGLGEPLLDIQPVALATGVAHWIGNSLWQAPIWFFLWWTQPGYLNGALPPEQAANWSSLRRHLTSLALTVALLAALAAELGGSSPAVPILLTLSLAIARGWPRALVSSWEATQQTVHRRQQQRGLSELQVDLDKRERGLHSVELKQRQTGVELEVRLSTYRLMDQLLESIPRRPVFRQVGELVVQHLVGRFQVANVVLFWLESEHLTPVAWHTSLAERLASASLAGQSEPSVQAAMQTGVLQNFSGDLNHSDRRIFPEDQWSVAVPLPGRGCFYVGNPFVRDLSAEDAHFLEVLSRHAVLALDAAAWYQTLQLSLQSEAAISARNEALVHRLALVIDGVTQLIRLRDPQAMLESVGQILAPVVPHSVYYAESGPVVVHQGARERAELVELAGRVHQQQLPLLLLKPHRLAVPLMSERGSLGALVLERPEPAFSREDQDILSVLSYQLGSALVSAQLFAELQKTHAALRDSQAQLMQSSKMAAVGQLAGGVAHELNTPLGAVALAVEAAQLCLESKPERAQARLERATKAVGQMKEIVSKLLFYSRDARTGLRTTDVHEVLEDTLHIVGHQLRLDNIEVVRQFGKARPLLGNPNELQQVFTNLILNARDAMLAPGAAGNRLVLSTGEWEEGGLGGGASPPENKVLGGLGGGASPPENRRPGGVWVRLRDHGCGMPSDVVERIFEPFFTTKDVGKGTGLGLSVTAQLVQQHGGRIQVESRPGQGSQFEVRLPFTPPAGDVAS